LKLSRGSGENLTELTTHKALSEPKPKPVMTSKEEADKPPHLKSRRPPHQLKKSVTVL
jgi:hypothetical protein